MNVRVGGDLFQEKVPEFIKTLRADHVIVSSSHSTPLNLNSFLNPCTYDNLVLQFEMEADMSTTLFLDDFCVLHELSFLKHIPAFTNPPNISYNECYQVYTPDMGDTGFIPIDDEGVIIPQEESLKMVEALCNIHEAAKLEDLPLLINDADPLKKAYAQSRLKGMSLGSIIRAEVIREHGYVIPEIPVFRIIS
jgi:hypothetical protein